MLVLYFRTFDSYGAGNFRFAGFPLAAH